MYGVLAVENGGRARCALWPGQAFEGARLRG